MLTHAFFKALLFLGSGCVIIGTHHEQDMRKMGGLRKYMPITFVCYVIGMLALAGVPPFAGFFSKDEVLLVTFQRSKPVWLLATLASFLTAFYMTRQICMVFFGKWRGGHGHGDHGHGHGHHEPHEVSWNMWLPIAVLSVFALVLGFFGTPLVAGNLFHHYVAPEEHMSSEGMVFVMSLSVVVGLLGIFLGYLVYGRKPMEHADEPDPLRSRLFTILNNKWYIDEIYEATIIRFTMTCGVMFRLFDKVVVDGILHGIVWVTRAISQVFRWVGDELMINGGFDAGCESVRGSGGLLGKFQSGKVQNYFAFLGVGTIILLAVYFLKQ